MEENQNSATEINRPDVAVVLLTVNQCKTTVHCLKRLFGCTGPSFCVVVWDNGSRDGTADVIRRAFPEVLVHCHPENLGVASGRNAAAELAISSFNPSHLLFLDNDMLVEPDFIDALLKPFKRDEKLGQTQAKLRFIHDRQKLNDAGGCRINFWLGSTRPVGYGEIDHGQYDRPSECVACGGAMMVRTDVFLSLGGFDNRFDPFGPEDLDFSLRLTKSGYHALYVPEALAYHAVSHTYGGEYDEEYTRHKARHWLLLLKLHASNVEKAGFFLLGGPYLGFRLLVREARKKNLRAVRGIGKGLVDFFKSCR